MNVLEARRRLLGAGVYKKTVTGNPAIARGSLARMYPGIEMQGWTEQKSTTGAQLLQLEADVTPSSDPYYPGYTVTKNGLTATVLEDGGIQITGSDTTENEWNNIILVTFTKNGQYKLPPGTYTVTDCIVMTNVGNKGSTFAIEEEATVLGWYITYVAGTSNVDDIHYPMLNAGSTALPYEPYTGGAPSPSPEYPQEIVSAGNYDEASGKYQYEVKLAGANLWQNIETPITKNGVTVTLDEEGYFVLNGMCTTSYNFIFRNVTLHTGQYTLSMQREGNFPDSELLLQIYSGTNGSLCGLNNNSASTSVTRNVKSASNDYEFRMRIDAGFNYNNSKVRPMLNIGSTALPYEPYKPPQTLTLTSDRPLTKWDKLTKKDGQWGWEYGSAEIVFDGSDDEVWNITGTDEQIRAYLYMNDDVDQNAICDKYILGNAFNHGEFDTGGNYIRFNCYGIAEDSVSWKTWLQSNPITVLYQLAKPVFTPLSEIEQEALNALHTNRPTTILSNDAGCEMSLTYKTKKSLEVTA